MSGDEHRDQVREMIRSFAMSFNVKGAHPQKLERYVDVLAEYEPDQLRAGLDALKAEASMPSPAKIKDAISVALLREMLQAEAAERAEALRMLADPEMRQQLRDEQAEQAGDLLHADDVLAELVADAEQVGLVGEDRALKLVFLALHTRHFDGNGKRPVSVVVKGASSSGKSHTVKCAIRFLADGSVVEMTGMSPKWMAYASQKGMTFSNKMLFVHEASGIDEEVEAMLRVLLSENRIVWRTVIEQEAVDLVVEGPTGLIETTTRLSVHPENETRLLSVPVDESTEQTQRVLQRLGEGHTSVDLSRWHALDRWVALGARDAVVPFERHVGELAQPVAPRVRRDMTTLLCLVRAHALLHEARRERDADGRVIGTLDDYQAVHELTEDIFAAGVEMSVPKPLRKVVGAVADILKDRAQGGPPYVTTAELAAKLEWHRGVVSRHVGAALRGEFLEDLRRQADEGSTSPHRLVIGSRPLPDAVATVFPSRDALATALGANGGAAAPEPGPAEAPAAEGEVPF